jgi:hypothetical protein
MAKASTKLLEVVANALQTVNIAFNTIYVTNVHFHMASTVPEVVVYVLQTVNSAI